MKLTEEALVKALERAKSIAKKRRFVQSYELIVVLRDIDLRRPENRILQPIFFPYVPPEKFSKICVIATGDLALKAKEANVDRILSREELNELAGNKKEAKKLASTYDFFLSQPDLMVHVGRILGRFLGPRGKIPIVLPPNVDVKAYVNRYRKARMIRIRDQPQLMSWIGTETQPIEQVVKNAMTVIEVLKGKYNLEVQLRKAFVKLTMGPAVRVV